MSTDIEIKAGPELDARIGTILGHEVFTSEPKVVNSFLTEPAKCFVIHRDDPETEPDYVEFCPSTDLNAAFAAAEKVGLFDGEEYRGLLKDGDDSWEASLILGVPFLEVEAIANGPTPALAICAAILKLRG